MEIDKPLVICDNCGARFRGLWKEVTDWMRYQHPAKCTKRKVVKSMEFNEEDHEC